jgi:fumarylacetoacetase
VTALGFGRDVLPYGVFSSAGRGPRVGVAVDDGILDLAEALGEQWAVPSLNPFMAQGREAWRTVREQVRDLVDRPLVDPADVTLHLPFAVGDFVDFYASEQHATNLGRMFRPDSEPLLPNWKHLPVGYHGRGGTVTVGGTPVRRPCGLRLPGPEYGPSGKLDVEVELGFVVGMPSALGDPVSAAQFEDVVFGAVVVNDWSARDVQAYEYVPLGPFLGKSFQTSISPWVVPLTRCRARGRRSRILSRRSTCGAAATGRWTWSWSWSSTARCSAGRRSGTCTGRRRRCWRT